MEIKIKDNIYTIKYTNRAIFIFEELTNKAFTLEKTIDFFIFYYSMILANNSECTVTFDEFVNEIDENPTIIGEFKNYLSEVFKMDKQFNHLKEEDDSKKK